MPRRIITLLSWNGSLFIKLSYIDIVCKVIKYVLHLPDVRHFAWFPVLFFIKIIMIQSVRHPTPLSTPQKISITTIALYIEREFNNCNNPVLVLQATIYSFQGSCHVTLLRFGSLKLRPTVKGMMDEAKWRPLSNPRSRHNYI